MTDLLPPLCAGAAKPVRSAPRGPQSGLTSDEVRCRSQEFGPNAMPDATPRPLRSALGKLWAPVPWMLEAAILLQIVLGDYVEAGVVALAAVLEELACR